MVAYIVIEVLYDTAPGVLPQIAQFHFQAAAGIDISIWPDHKTITGTVVFTV